MNTSESVELTFELKVIEDSSGRTTDCGKRPAIDFDLHGRIGELPGNGALPGPGSAIAARLKHNLIGRLIVPEAPEPVLCRVVRHVGRIARTTINFVLEVEESILYNKAVAVVGVKAESKDRVVAGAYCLHNLDAGAGVCKIPGRSSDVA